jgi:hypothetical protein
MRSRFQHRGQMRTTEAIGAAKTAQEVAKAFLRVGLDLEQPRLD